MNEEITVARRCRGAGARRRAGLAHKKQLVIVVKGLDNPFFEAINQGCQKWNSENASSEYECFYTGPASTSDEAGEAQIVQDMLGKPDTAAMAISPSNAKLIAQTIKTANPTIPIMTLDADLAAEDAGAAQDLSRHRQLPDGRHASANTSRRRKPNGGKICTDRGQPRRRQHPAPRPGHARRADRPEGPGGARRAKAAGPKSPAARCSPMTTAPRACRR